MDHKKPMRRRAAAPKHLQNQILQEHHRGRMAGHFSGNRLYATYVPYVTSGGGRTCILMPLVSVGIVLNVL